MMCKNPFFDSYGINKKTVILSNNARQAATPKPCGQCLHCRINKAREWTNRLLLENRTSTDSAFITLTYDEDHIPGRDLVPDHLQKFIKKFRRKNEPYKLRYFAVGEYGDTSWRPHYHLAMFSNGLLQREKLQDTWGKGFTQCGDLNSDSARYLTGYVTKKLTSAGYHKLDGRSPEFMRCSKQNGGLGINAIKEIAKKLKECGYFEPRILREINYGRKSMPLGKYLTEKLANELGITEQEFRLAYWDYQQEIFDKNLTDDQYRVNVDREKAQNRLSQMKKHKIYSPSRKL